MFNIDFKKSYRYLQDNLVFLLLRVSKTGIRKLVIIFWVDFMEKYLEKLVENVRK